MKRLSNICISCVDLKPNEFNSIFSKDKMFVAYTDKQRYYSKGYLERVSFELPYIDVYEIRAMSKTGLVCGYAFDLLCKEPTIDSNFIVCANKSFDLSLNEVSRRKTHLKMNYKFKGINAYSVEGQVGMLTLSNHKDTKEKMDM